MLLLAALLMNLPAQAGRTKNIFRLKSCELRMRQVESFHHFRAELMAAHLADRASGRRLARISNQLFGRVAEIDSLDIPRNSHVVSLGSGPDIYSPLFLYPQAVHYHLVDSMNQWPGGSYSMVKELERRLESIHPKIAIHRKDEYVTTLFGDIPAGGTAKWEVGWRDGTGAIHMKTVYLHRLNFNESLGVKVLMGVIPATNLGGIVVTGTGINPKLRGQLLLKLHPYGSMFTEMLNQNSRGNVIAKEDAQTLAWLKKAGFKITDLGPPNYETGEPPAVIARRFEIRR